MFGEEQWPHCTHCTHCNAPACFFNRIPRSSNRQSPERWCCGDGPPLVTGAFKSGPSLTAGCRSFKIWNMTLVAQHNWTVLYVRFGKCFYSKALCRDMNYFSFVLLKHGWSQRRWISDFCVTLHPLWAPPIFLSWFSKSYQIILNTFFKPL